MTTAIPRYANSELVATAWIRDVVTAYDVAVGTTLQGPNDSGVLSWVDTGFITTTVVSGNPGGDIPLRRPVMSVDVYATMASKKRPPWGRAAGMCELIIRATREWDWGAVHGAVALPDGYPSAYVSYAEVLSEPKRRPGDEANYARYGFELALGWVELPA